MASTPSYALAQIWPSLAAPKLDTLNAMMVAGPNVDISISVVAGYLLLRGIYPTVVAFSAGSPLGEQPHDGALIAAKTFVAWITLQGAPDVHMSQPDVFAAFNQLSTVMVAQETAVPGSTGFTQAAADGLLALAQTQIPWWQANGFDGPVTASDVASAGLS